MIHSRSDNRSKNSLAHVYYDNDANLGLIQKKCVAIIGYGNQGHAHALNMRDNGCNVIIGLSENSRSRPHAERDGFRVLTVPEATEQADLIMLLIPDEAHHQVFVHSILPRLTAGKMLLTAHGFSLHYSQIVPPSNIDAAMVAPKG